MIVQRKKIKDNFINWIDYSIPWEYATEIKSIHTREELLSLMAKVFSNIINKTHDVSFVVSDDYGFINMDDGVCLFVRFRIKLICIEIHIHLHKNEIVCFEVDPDDEMTRIKRTLGEIITKLNQS